MSSERELATSPMQRLTTKEPRSKQHATSSEQQTTNCKPTEPTHDQRATSDKQEATSNENHATSDNWRATSNERRLPSAVRRPEFRKLGISESRNAGILAQEQRATRAERKRSPGAAVAHTSYTSHTIHPAIADRSKGGGSIATCIPPGQTKTNTILGEISRQ